MKRIQLILAVTFALGAGVALADRSVTWLTSGARVDTVCLRRASDGTIDGEAIGTADQLGGGPPLMTPVRWRLSGTAATQAAAFLDGPALTKWKNQEGL